MKEQETHTAYVQVRDDDGTCSMIWEEDGKIVRTKHGGHAVDNGDGTATITWPDGTVTNALSFTKKR
jgi:hypothetical protein